MQSIQNKEPALHRNRIDFLFAKNLQRVRSKVGRKRHIPCFHRCFRRRNFDNVAMRFSPRSGRGACYGTGASFDLFLMIFASKLLPFILLHVYCFGSREYVRGSRHNQRFRRHAILQCVLRDLPMTIASFLKTRKKDDGKRQACKVPRPSPSKI